MAGFIPLGNKGKKDLIGSVGSRKGTATGRKSAKVRLTSLPSDWFPCLDQQFPPLLPLLPLRNCLPRYSRPLSCGPPLVLVPPGFLLHPGAKSQADNGTT